jgi:hypothetical protein
LRLNAWPEPLDNATQKYLFKPALPRFAKKPVEVLCLFLVLLLLSVAEEFVRTLPFVPDVADTLLHSHGQPRKLFHTDARAHSCMADMLIMVLDTHILRGLMQGQQEHNVMRKYDDLAHLRFLHEPRGHRPPPYDIQRGYGIVKHNAGGIIRGAQLGKKGRDRKASLLTFADHLWQYDARRTGEDEFVIKNPFCSASFLEFNFDMSEAQTGKLFSEARLKSLRHDRFGNSRTFLGDSCWLGFVETLAVRAKLTLAVDLIEKGLLMFTEQNPGIQLPHLRFHSLALRFGCRVAQRLEAGVNILRDIFGVLRSNCERGTLWSEVRVVSEGRDDGGTTFLVLRYGSRDSVG